jgi:hypothetical protein
LVGQDRFVFEISELPRKKRRRRPRRPLDHTARRARLQLEAQIFREPLVPVLVRFPPDQLQQLDDERRVAAFGNIPSRCGLIRSLIGEALMWRRSMRPKDPPRPARGVPFEINLDDWPDI